MHSDSHSTSAAPLDAAGVQARRRQLLMLLISAPWLPSLAQGAESAANTVDEAFVTLSKVATGR